MGLKNIGNRFNKKYRRTVKVVPKQNSNPEQPEPEQPESKGCIGKLCERMTLKKRVAPNDTTRVGGKTKRRKRKRRRNKKTRRYHKR